jgi:5-(carboxyamino)imidazole ribonucleotide mutase
MSALVGVIMGSKSDWPTMKIATEMLEELSVPYEVKVVSAHRTPDLMFEYADCQLFKCLVEFLWAPLP